MNLDDIRNMNDYELKSKYYCSSANVGDKKHFLHPTIKPLNVVENHLKHVTQEITKERIDQIEEIMFELESEK